MVSKGINCRFGHIGGKRKTRNPGCNFSEQFPGLEESWPSKVTLTCCDKLIYDDLGIVAEVPKLGFPDGQGAASGLQGVAVLKAQCGGLVQRRVVYLHRLLLALWGNGVQQGQPANPGPGITFNFGVGGRFLFKVIQVSDSQNWQATHREQLRETALHA
jgi:hypothetical protein